MLVLNEENHIINTDFINRIYRFGVLSFEDVRNPDFFFRTSKEIMMYNAAGITLEFGEGKQVYQIVVPLHWWILCAELGEVQTIPLYEMSRNDYKAFCFNPINGYRPEYLNLRVATDTPSIYPNANWTSPPLADKDLILIPLGEQLNPGSGGPHCAIFSTTKYEVNCGAADLW